MDRAVLRPGRFGKLLYVPLPTADERGLILKALARKKPIDANVDLCAVAQMKACESLSGADLSALVCTYAFLFLHYVCWNHILIVDDFAPVSCDPFL